MDISTQICTKTSDNFQLPLCHISDANFNVNRLSEAYLKLVVQPSYTSAELMKTTGVFLLVYVPLEITKFSIFSIEKGCDTLSKQLHFFHIDSSEVAAAANRDGMARVLYT